MVTQKKPRRRATEMEALRLRLEEAEETLRAIRSGEVDALVVSSAAGERLYTLKDADRPYRHLVEQINEGACTLSAEGVVLFANSYLADLLGAPLEQVMGQPFSAWVRAEDQRHFTELLHQSLTAGAKGELELVSVGGEARPVQLSLSLLQGEEGPRITVVLFDLRERRRSEQALRRLNEQLEQRVADRTNQLETANQNLAERSQALADANTELEVVNKGLRTANEQLVQANRRSEKEIAERKQMEDRLQCLNRELERQKAELQTANKELESFSYSVSHDLRAPLGSIDGFVGMILEDYGAQLPPETTNLVQLIRQNAQEMSRLIEALLLLSRTSRQVLTREAVAPREVAAEVLQMLQTQYQSRQVELRVEDMPSCQADPVLLRQVYANLLSNALKFTRHCPIAQIHIGQFVDKGESIYFVKDNGVGFDMEQAGKLFGVFQRLHGEEEYEGTGIGLAIVQRIIHRHGGRVWAEGEVDQGATFYFTLG